LFDPFIKIKQQVIRIEFVTQGMKIPCFVQLHRKLSELVHGYFYNWIDEYFLNMNSIDSSATQPATLILRQGLELYYQSNPEFTRNQDLQVGWIRIPWRDLARHDMMHVVTGYSTRLDEELRLIGFLLTAVTWRRPWYYYAQSLLVFLELFAMSLRGKSWGDRYYHPFQVCQLYWQGVRQGFTVQKKINAYIDPETVLDQELRSLRQEYGITNAGAWD
jgi:hypothetical protein